MPLWVYSDTAMLGAGTSSNPYQISTAEQLAQLATWVNDGNTAYNDKYYIQTANLDLSAYENWTPIGLNSTSYYFRGTYDGNGLGIYNLTIANTDGSIGNRIGLFGAVYLAKLKNISVMSGSLSIYNGHIGGIVGSLYHSSISGCYNNATVTSTSALAHAYCGGVVGYAYNSGSVVAIDDCFNSGEIIANMTTVGSKYAGGILGWCNTNIITLSNCLNAGAISSTTGVTLNAVGATATITDSYYDTVSGCADSNATARVTANCQGTDALTLSTKLDGLGTTNWFARAGDYPLPIKFKP